MRGSCRSGRRHRLWTRSQPVRTLPSRGGTIKALPPGSRGRASRLEILGFALPLLALACGGSDDSCSPSASACGEEERFPALFSQFDATGAISYEPRWVLWSNGLEKDRRILLPSSARVDISDRDHWEFPEGTSLIKTFSVRGPDGNLTKVETRIIRRHDDGWETAVYIWRADQSDADLERTGAPVAVTVTNQEGKTFDHTVPGRSDCTACHGSSPAFLLGFRELQLNRDDQLQRLDQLGVFAEELPESPDVVEADDPETEWVLGYVTANCVHCHNGATEFDLSHDVFLDVTVGQPGPSSGETLIDPGSPGTSFLFHRFESREMPPLGVQLRDDQAVERLRRWILTLQE